MPGKRCALRVDVATFAQQTYTDSRRMDQFWRDKRWLGSWRLQIPKALIDSFWREWPHKKSDPQSRWLIGQFPCGKRPGPHPTLRDVDFEAGTAVLLAAQVAGVAAGLAGEAGPTGQHASTPDAPLRERLAGVPVMLHCLVCEGAVAAWAARQAHLRAQKHCCPCKLSSHVCIF